MPETLNQYAAIDLAALPPPQVIEKPDFEDLLQQIKEQINGYRPLTFDGDKQPVFVEAEIVTDPNGERYFKIPVDSHAGLLYLDRESDPITRVAEVTAYREMDAINRSNMRAYAVMVAYAKDSDLDQIGADFGVFRLVIDEGNPDGSPPVPRTMEPDEDYRRRIVLSPEGLSVAGPSGAYIFFSLTADGEVLDAFAEGTKFDYDPESGKFIVEHDAGLDNPKPGNVAVTLLSRSGDGTASPELIAKVFKALNHDDIRPLTDIPVVRSAEIVNYQVKATLYTYNGPDPEVVMKAAQDNIEAYVTKMHRIGLDVSISGIYQALHVEGVQRVELETPTGTIPVNVRQASFCTEIKLTYGGVDA